MNNNMEKRYGLGTAVCMVIGIVIGSGIFFKTEAVLELTDKNALTGVLSLLIIGIIMFFCAYAFSLMAQKHGRVNGVVDYAEAACGPKYAYYLAWFFTFAYTPGITSVLGWVSAVYFGSLFGFSPTSGETLVLASLFLFGLAFLNAVSPQLAGKTQISTTIIKLIPLGLMAVFGIFKGLSNGQLVQNFQTASLGSTSAIHGLTASVVSLAFAFEGWILVTSIHAELKDAHKNLPRALILGLLAIVAIYVFYYLGICGAVSVDELIANGSPQAFKNMFGEFFGTLLTVFIFISCLGTTNGLVMANSRNMYALAVRGNGPMPKFFAHVDETTKMPVNSAFFGALISIIWLVYYFGANQSTNWFGVFSFDSSELVIVAVYVFYIPIFLKMYTDHTQNFFHRFLVPTMAILSCIFVIGCAVYAHGIVKYKEAAANGGFAFPILFFTIFTVILLLIGKYFYHSDDEKTGRRAFLFTLKRVE